MTTKGFKVKTIFKDFKYKDIIEVSNVNEVLTHPQYMSCKCKGWPLLAIGEFPEAKFIEISSGKVLLHSRTISALSSTADARGVDFHPYAEGKGIILVVNHQANTERDFEQWLGRVGRHMTPCI